MRLSWLLIAATACKPGGVTSDQERCAKAATMFARCETLEGDPIDREIVVDRWRGLCRAVFTGKTDHLFPDALQIFADMDDATKQSLRDQATCTAETTTCQAYRACASD